VAFQYLTNIPLERAKRDYEDILISEGFRGEAEEIPAVSSLGRTTASPVYAKICSPHYPASAMDGIAIRAEDTFGATETAPVLMKSDGFTMVDTGDPVPEDCDAVIMIEDVIYGEDGSARITAPAAPWQHIRQIGEDICAGEMILPSYTEITPAAIGAMLAGGVMKVSVIRRPTVGIIPTGDEIIPPTDDPEPGKIMEFNSAIFSAMLVKWGAVPKTYPIVPDQPELVEAAVRRAAEECDMVLLNAGSSAGREDYSAAAIASVGKVLHHGIAMRPGKPAILGYAGKKPILGVPGYPVSGILVLEELLKPLILKWYNHGGYREENVSAVLSRPVVSGLKYREFVRVRLGKVGDKLVASPLNRGSGVVTSFVKADGILDIPQGKEGCEAGETVTVRLLRRKSDIEHTLVVTGSHDPLLDELGDMLHASDSSLYMSSWHVGSMGGIMAVRRRETHMAGIHLLNESDGTYNRSAVNKYFPQGGVRLVECVGRTQGLMVQKGSPKGIRSIGDLTAPGVRYVNRQKGSGTRILTDHLCRKEGIDAEKIYGYGREELTHTSVAAQIAMGTADAGMGIYSAAKLYGLDFIPVCTEQYDLLIPDCAWDTTMVQKLIEILSGPEFTRRIEKMGGYTIDRPGRVRSIK